MNDVIGVKMYGPQMWAKIKDRQTVGACAPQMAGKFDWLADIGKKALSIFVDAQQSATYKQMAEQQAAERQQVLNNLVKYGGIALAAAVAYKFIKG